MTGAPSASVNCTGASAVGLDHLPFTTMPWESTHASPVPITWATETGSPTTSTSPGLATYGTNQRMTFVGVTRAPPSTTWGVPLLVRLQTPLAGS